MHPCPHVVHPESPVCQVFNLFRTMGLRHLPVINSAGEVMLIAILHDLICYLSWLETRILVNLIC